MVHGVRLRGGKAEWYRNRWVRGARIAADLGEDPPSGRSNGDRDFGPNTAVGGFAGKTWAMVEAGTTPMTLTYELDTIGYDGFDGTLPGGFTATPGTTRRRANSTQSATPTRTDSTGYSTWSSATAGGW